MMQFKTVRIWMNGRKDTHTHTSEQIACLLHNYY